MRSKIVTYSVLTVGALAFLFPFYYMIAGSLQTSPDTSIAGAFPHPSNLTVENYTAIDGRINLLQAWRTRASSPAASSSARSCSACSPDTRSQC